MPRYPEAQVPRCPEAQMPRNPDAQKPRCLEARMPGYPGAQIPRCPGAQRPRSPDAQKPRCPEAPMPRCLDAQKPRCPNVHQSRTILYWAQCYLVGIKKVIIGYRNKGNWCEKYSIVRTKDLVNLSYASGLWNCKQGIVGLQNFLGEVKKVVLEEGKLYLMKLDYGLGEVSYFDSGKFVFL